MLLFRSEEHIDAWCESRGLPRGGTLTLDQCWRVADRWYRRRMALDWRRYTLDEAEAIFAELGMVGSFWSLRL